MRLYVRAHISRRMHTHEPAYRERRRIREKERKAHEHNEHVREGEIIERLMLLAAYHTIQMIGFISKINSFEFTWNIQWFTLFFHTIKLNVSPYMHIVSVLR